MRPSSPPCWFRALCRARLLLLRGRKRRDDDVLISGAAAKVPGYRNSHLLLRRVRIVAQEFDQRRENPRSAEAALQPMVLVKGLLQRVQVVRRRRDPLGCQEVVTVGLHG